MPNIIQTFAVLFFVATPFASAEENDVIQDISKYPAYVAGGIIGCLVELREYPDVDPELLSRLEAHIPVFKKHNDFHNTLDEERQVKPEFVEEYNRGFDKILAGSLDVIPMMCMYWDVYLQGISMGMKMGN